MDITELKRLAEGLISANEAYIADECNDALATNWAAADDAYQNATLPEAILTLIAENEALMQQVSTLQSDANSWQSGYDEGRRMGDKTARTERDQLKADLQIADTACFLSIAENKKLKFENGALLDGMTRIMRATRLGDSAFAIACEVIGELSGAAMGKGEQP
ncbi:hypothetical protein [Pseudomonas brassicacearum]|uniref:Uncharacterized protein n=1 Tax=Pseudomonas brassicacearum TaxID=930166 RepID=A0A423GP05_9PSED|nr:hypothetical protein [Pseudomonas brassicacearum]ROM94412.1 hypothetical protein BK658_17810 [Pseudomonas brassicacearum]